MNIEYNGGESSNLEGAIFMANKENTTLRIEPDLKRQAAALFKALGMDLSTATGIFIGKRCGTKDCRLKCVWMSRMTLPMLRWKRWKRKRTCMGHLIVWLI